MGTIVIKHNGKVIDNVELKKGDIKIGRRSGCDIVLDHPGVSGEHAHIYTLEHESFIQDLNSTNGTFINNKRVTKHQLSDGDVVIIGEYSLVYLLDFGGTKPVEEHAKKPESAAPEEANLTIR